MTYHTLLGGFDMKASEAFKWGMNLVWNTADAALDPFRMVRGEEWSAPKPNQWFNFTQTHTYSDLDVERVYGQIYGQFYFNETLWLWAGYTYQDYADNAPYLYDTTGSADTYAARLGWSF
jgi:hypothetical protein